MITVIANWKSNKNISSARQWVYEFLENLEGEIRDKLDAQKLRIVICPPSPLLVPVKQLISEYSGISVGAQDVSAYPEGKFTGEVSARSLKDLASHVIVGHAERRRSTDTPALVKEKLRRCEEVGLEPILCVSTLDEVVKGLSIYSYEPIAAIGTGNNAKVPDVLAFKTELTITLGTQDFTFIYGGSVDASKCMAYLQTGEIHGFLVGSASLDALTFAELVESCAKVA
jgi:triosephosphate isomerase